MNKPSIDGAALQSLHERGAERLDPVRWRLIQSLVKRAQGHEGPARQVLDAKVAVLAQAMGDALTQAEALATNQTDYALPDQATLSKQNRLAGLLDHLAHQKLGMVPASGVKPSAHPSQRLAASDSPVDPQTLQFFRRTWSRLSSDQRLAQTRSSLPQNAGPLNSQHLVHRALAVMRELSPEYFDLFISQVDALLWLERVNEQSAREVGLAPKAKGIKKTAASKRG